MKVKLATLAGLAALVIAVPVHAQDSGPAEGAESMGEMNMDGPTDTEEMGNDGMGRMRPHGRRAMMQRMDADGNGTISVEEFSELGIGDLIKADADTDGELTVEEISAAMEARRKERMADRFKRRYDVDGDGKITVAELKDRQEKHFALLDANNDGSISPEEFRRMRGMMRGHMGGGFGDHERRGRHHWGKR